MAGPGADHLEDALNEVLSGTTHHGGALFAPFGGALRGGRRRLAATGGRRAARPASSTSTWCRPRARRSSATPPRCRPPPSSTRTRTPTALMHSGTPADVARLGAVDASSLDPIEGGWSGGQGRGPVYVSTEFQGSWQLDGSDLEPRRAFGWATSFEPVEAPVSVHLRGAVPGHDPGAAPGPGLDRGAVDHQEAGGAMRARGQGVLTLILLGVIVLGAVGLDRLGTKSPARRSRAKPRAEPGSAPTAAGLTGTPPSPWPTRAMPTSSRA